jgi:hypothetical protein
MRNVLFTAVVAFLVGGCGVALPDVIRSDEIPRSSDDNVKRSIQGCVHRLDSDRNAAKADRDLGNAIAITGGVIAAGSGLASTLLAATLPDDTMTDDHRGQKIGAAVTGAFAAATAIVSVLAKLIEDPTVPLARRAKAEAHWTLGRKALALEPGYATARFISCSTQAVPPEVELPAGVPRAAPPP